MAEAILLPKLGNSVESAIILAWHAAVGDEVHAGMPICEVETDKATMDIESSADGLLLAQLAQPGDEVPVLQNIAVVGAAGEAVDSFLPAPVPAAIEPAQESVQAPASPASAASAPEFAPGRLPISPRARNLVQRKGLDPQQIPGSGPGGRIIERDVAAALQQQVALTPVAQAMLDSGDYALPAAPRAGRIGKGDMVPADTAAGRRTPLRGRRKLIAQRMLQSMQNSAQLSLHRSADARALQALRARCKASDTALGLRGISINDMLLFAVARTLPDFPSLNAHFVDDTIIEFEAVQLALAVDSERGLLVPVIGAAHSLPLTQLSREAKRLAAAARDGSILPDEMAGGSFTVSNLGALGIERFTPVLNPPQVAILGVGGIQLQAVEREGAVEFLPRIGLSLTINHQVVDGAPAARFLQQLAANLAQIDLLALS